MENYLKNLEKIETLLLDNSKTLSELQNLGNLD